MNEYNVSALKQMQQWQKQMLKSPGIFNRLSKKIQTKINNLIPEKVHNAITATIKQMVKGVLFGAKILSPDTLHNASLENREIKVKEKIEKYRTTAAVEGGITGAGGILLGLADFPILLSIKIKLLFDIASLYGFNVNDYRERIYILHIFELSFSSDEHRKNVFKKMQNWKQKSLELPEDINAFEWRNFQQEYRDYIDLAKMAQLIPVIGAPVGAIVNYRLLKKLGHTAVQAYRMRIL